MKTFRSQKFSFLFPKALFIYPSIEEGLVARTHPDNPRHPQQKYFLTELGLAVLEMLKKQAEEFITQNK